ncbi:MAG TPA: C40 family peptidase [Steroidobacteraceae bacterium]|nr:C40 family peptidase [Steroidobacteraceae bacterium]
MRRAPRATAAGALLIAALLLTACATPPRRPAAPPDPGATMAALAVSLVGTPYQFGGADAAGFDCSGLALYVHARAGLAIPRTASEQRRAAHPVPLAALAPGDLIFFRIHSRHVDHVGIYVGGGRFVHAPRAGGAVAYGELGESGYYRARVAGAGRFWGGISTDAPPR